MEAEISGVKLKVLKGSIFDVEVEAIVNPANSQMRMGGGLAGAIKRAAGPEVEEEALKHAPVPVGEAVATHAGKLKFKYVIHSPTMEMPAMSITSDKVYKATYAALKCADENNVSSLAIPGMGTGIGGVPPDIAASVMLRAVKDYFARGETKIKEIVFVDINEEIVNGFKKALKAILQLTS